MIWSLWFLAQCCWWVFWYLLARRWAIHASLFLLLLLRVQQNSASDERRLFSSGFQHAITTSYLLKLAAASPRSLVDKQSPLPNLSIPTLFFNRNLKEVTNLLLPLNSKQASGGSRSRPANRLIFVEYFWSSDGRTAEILYVGPLAGG